MSKIDGTINGGLCGFAAGALTFAGCVLAAVSAPVAIGAAVAVAAGGHILGYVTSDDDDNSNS